MSVNQRQIAAFIEENFVDSDNTKLDYLTLSEPSSIKKRSWREFASIRVGDRELGSVLSEVSKHVENTIESAREGGSDEVAIKVNLYRNKEAAGSRTWREEIEQEEKEEETTTVDKSTAAVLKQLVDTNKQLQTLVIDLVGKNTAMAAKGYELANKAIESKQAAEVENGELKALLAVAQVEGNTTQDEIMKMGASALVEVVKNVAMKKMSESKQLTDNGGES